jgi:hypothetical protein
MSKTHMTLKEGKVSAIEVLPRAAPQPIPEPDPNWPYNPEAQAIAFTLTRALQHFQAIRAKGSTPLEGGPSFPIAERTAEAFAAAAELAQEFWPVANTFEIVGSDAHFPSARMVSDGLPDTATMLRLALPIAEFTLKHAPAGLLAIPADDETVAKAPPFPAPPGPFPPGER